jgi:hypothetical protein
MPFADVAGLSGTVQEKIFEDAVRLDREVNIAKGLVEFKSDLSDMRPRQYNLLPTLAAQSLGEYDDLASAQAFNQTPGNIVSPERVGNQVFLTDPREAQDPGVQADIARELAEGIALKDEIALLTQVSTFDKTIGDGTAATSIEDLRKAVSYLNSKGFRMRRKVAVLDEWQWFAIARLLDVNSTPTNVSERIKESVQGSWYVTSMGDLDIFVTSNVVKPTGTTAKGGVFVKDAIIFDERRGLHLEPQRDASREGTEINLHEWRGIGKWAPGRGITMHGLIAPPSI